MANRLKLTLWICFAILTRPVYGDRASDAYKHGLREERKADYDAAYAYYKQAYTITPTNPKYLAAYTHMRFSAAAQHVHSGQILRNTGALTAALTEFQRAAEIDTSNFIAQQELRWTSDMIRRKERQQSTPAADVPVSKLADGVIPEIVELQPLSNAPINLHLTVNADIAYKTICKVAGVNVLLDPDYRPQKVTIDLTDVTLRDALEMLRLESKTFWRPVLPNTIFVAADSPGKRKELEQNVMRTFYLQNITTPAELQEAANMVRQMLDIPRVQLLQAQDALIVRGTPDQMVLAEKLLGDFDKPKPEVVIDVAVMQVSRDRMRTLGTNVPTTASVGPLASTSGASTGSPGGGGSGNSGGYTLGKGSFAVSISGGSFTFLASDSNAKILQNPEIRAINNEKATLRIGDRVPIATGSFQPGIIGGGGVSPLVSTQFQYLDVGVNIDITPHIHSDREVTLKMVLEISSVTGTQTIGGITQPVIGQRRIEHETRLADGDVNLLGGILEETETQSLSGYPWVSKIPILKYLFAQENALRQENEIIFAITPHIVRSHSVNEDDVKTIDVGTGGGIALRRKAPAPLIAEPAKSNGPGQAAPVNAVTPAPASQSKTPAGAQGKPGTSR